jgi:signal peptide peptidase SppA
MRRDGLKYEHVLSFALEHPWAITPAMLHLIAGTLARRIAGEDVDPAQVAAALVARANRVPTASSEPTVALIPIYGVIAPRMNLFSDMSGGATFEGLTAQLHEALAIPSIKTIVFDIDSPGGNVAGATEFAREVMEARTQVRVIAQANHLMASAAYWVASAATEIVASPSALVGSVGVYTIHNDISGALAKLGVKRDVIAAGKYKAEGIDGGPLSIEAREHVTSLIDASYDRFIGDVAKGRGVKPSAVRQGYGEGRVLNADQARAAAMVDRIATLPETLKRFTPGATASGARALDGSAATDDPSSQESRSADVLVAYEQRLLALERSAVQ